MHPQVEQDDIGRQTAVEGAACVHDPAGSDDAALVRIKDLPREVGAMLLSVGVLGWVLPGMAGTPALLAGGLVLWPNAFGKIEGWFQRRYPVLHRQSMRQVARYLDDLERRYSNGGVPSAHQNEGGRNGDIGNRA